MSWIIMRGTVLNEGILENQARVVRTLLVETENGERIVIAPKEKILNKLSPGDIVEFETQKGKDAKLTWYLGRVKRNCRNLRIISH